MRGSILKRKTGYFIVYDAPRKWEGKTGCHTRNRKWEKVPAPNTRKHAERLLAERLSQLHRGEFVEPTKITFATFADKWIEKYARVQVRPSTLVLYEGFLKNHLDPVFGNMVLAKIGTEDIQGFKAGKTAAGLSPSTVKQLLGTLRQIFNHAIEWDYIHTNPAKHVKNPKILKSEMGFLTPDEVRVLLAHVPNRWYAFFLTAITTGLRVGELLAMKWGNLDWNIEKYYVKETMLRAMGGHASGFAPPKTDTSAAPINLTPSCIKALQQHRRRQSEDRLKSGGSYQDLDLIFATPIGTPLDSCNIVKKIFHPALKAAGLHRIRFHDLRHTCASLLINQGESPKYIQSQLRHASIDMTFDRYGHLFPDAGKEAAARMDETLFGNQEKLESAV
jgi:integrase